jgi:threonine dehydratase
MEQHDMIDLAAVRRAATTLFPVVRRTPVHTSRTLNERVGCEVFLKCENFQRGGAFKFRGAYNAISRLAPEERARGVLAFSSGNHAQGVALAARLLGVSATICMPDDAPAVKLAATRDYGAEVVQFQRATVDREVFAREVAGARNLTIIPPFDHPHIIAGQGTAALELLEEVPDLDALVVPVGGGGLLAGSALALHGIAPTARLYGVETEGADDWRLSLVRGERVRIAPPTTIADGMRTLEPGRLTFPIVRRHIEALLVVNDAEVLAAMRWLLLRTKLVVEPTGAVGLAAVLQGLLPPAVRRVGVLISGGNLDPAILPMLWPA